MHTRRFCYGTAKSRRKRKRAEKLSYLRQATLDSTGITQQRGMWRAKVYRMANTPSYLCAWTAWALWHRLRCTKRPRLDQTETVVHELRRFGLRPSSMRELAETSPADQDYLSLVEPELRDLQKRLLERAEPKTHAPSRQHRKRTHEEGQAWGRSLPPAAAAGLEELAPVDLLVPTPQNRRKSSLRTCHIWGSPMPSASFVPLIGGVHLAMPEFVFLQLAPRLSLPRLIMLGFEACGFYGAPRPGCLATDRCMPLTSVGRLQRFVDTAGGAYGVKRARSALRFVLDGSASIMESAMVVLACLPRSHGGYGLPLPTMNPRIDVPATKRELLGRSWVTCDAFWPEARFALEYDGRRDHTGNDNLMRDYARASDLVALGIATDTITKETLFNTHQFDKTVRKVAKSIGYKLNARDFGTTWHRKREELRDDIIAYLHEHDSRKQMD